jgi:hypothetical protein
VSLALPPFTAVQLCGLGAMAALYQLDLQQGVLAPGTQRKGTLQKTAAAPGALPEGAAAAAITQLLDIRVHRKRPKDMQSACERVLQPLGLVIAGGSPECSAAADAQPAGGEAARKRKGADPEAEQPAKKRAPVAVLEAMGAQGVCADFVASDETVLTLPKYNSTQIGGLYAMAALHRLLLKRGHAETGVAKRFYVLLKTADAPGVAPTGDALAAVAQLLALRVASTAEMRDACRLVLEPLGLAPQKAEEDAHADTAAPDAAEDAPPEERGAAGEAAASSPATAAGRSEARARKRKFKSAEGAFSLMEAHDMCVRFVLSEDTSLPVPPVNAAQRCGLFALAALFKLQLQPTGPGAKRDRDYALHKTRAAGGELPSGEAEVVLARVLALKTMGKAEAQAAYARLLRPLGLAPQLEQLENRAREKDEAAKSAKAAKAAAKAAAAAPPPAPVVPALPPVQPVKWFIDRGIPGSAPPAAAAPADMLPSA